LRALAVGRMSHHPAPEVEAILVKLRASLKRRGAEGIRGLARHFKIVVPSQNVSSEILSPSARFVGLLAQKKVQAPSGKDQVIPQR